MPKLVDRNKQVPGGFSFYIPELKWASTPWASFETIVQGIIAVRKANPHLAQKNNWALDHDSVANELDLFNAKRAESMGWSDFYTAGTGGPVAPFTQARHSLNALQSVAAGSQTLVEWITSGAEAVASELANKRAGVCVACPLNQKGDWTRFFTVPASEAIRKALNLRREFKLETVHDANLGTCQACTCPLRLKIHLKIDRILSKMPQEDKDGLHKDCWIRSEGKF